MYIITELNIPLLNVILLFVFIDLNEHCSKHLLCYHASQFGDSEQTDVFIVLILKHTCL